MKDGQYFMIMGFLALIAGNQMDSTAFRIMAIMYLIFAIISSELFQAFIKGLMG